MKILVPDRNTGSCLDPGIPGTGLQRREGEGMGKIEAGPGPYWRGKGQLESSRDGENMMSGKEEPIQDVMRDARGSSPYKVRRLQIHSL